MKNPAPYLRKTIFALLNGNVTYNTVVIPVYEGEGEIIQNQIIIGGYSHAPVGNKASFMANGVQDVEIVTIKNDPSSKDSDAIAELVMNLIHPDVVSDLLSGTDFTINVQGVPAMLPIREQSISDQIVVRRVLRYNLLISWN